MKHVKIVTIGGGTGSPVVLQSLIKAGFRDLSAICTSTDSGGRTGIIRTDERDRVIGISDLLRNLLSLINPQDNHLENVSAFTEIASFTDGRKRNVGYMLYYALWEKYNRNFIEIQKLLEKLLGIHFLGTAIPVTLESATIYFKTESGNNYKGEHLLDYYSMSADKITKIWLEPRVDATPQAIEVITNADYIIYCPGSIYGSIIANFLPQGISRAIQKSHAKKIIITNLASTRNQDHNFKPLDYLHLFQKYLDMELPFNVMVCPNITEQEFQKKYPLIAKQYRNEHSEFLGWEDKDFEPVKQKGIEIIKKEVYAVTEQLQRLRHDHNKLAGILKKIIKKQI